MWQIHCLNPRARSRQMHIRQRRERCRPAMAALLAIMMLWAPTGLVSTVRGQTPAGPTPPAPPGVVEVQAPVEATPARVSYIDGDVSFWRPGGDDWAPARTNTPLAPGDSLYTGPRGNVEVQLAPRVFLRAADGARLELDNQEPDFAQVRVTSGTVAVDVRQLGQGSAIELDTPNAAVTIERPGFYRLDVGQDGTNIRAHRGGTATVTPAGDAAATIGTNQQATVTEASSGVVAITSAPGLNAWDQWNYQRTEYLVQRADTRYVSNAVYGTEALAQYGNWRVTGEYGPVWAPTAVPAGWSPYTTGRWIWDPRFGWTWLDDAPWGWAPYHYGRWVFVGNYWAWAPGPVVVRPVYAPALVVFLGGATISVGHPVCWAPLGWGEPVIPWWGRKEFVGVPSWRGWGGPRVVNNVVINRTTTVNVTNITE